MLCLREVTKYAYENQNQTRDVRWWKKSNSAAQRAEKRSAGMLKCYKRSKRQMKFSCLPFRHQSISQNIGYCFALLCFGSLVLHSCFSFIHIHVCIVVRTCLCVMYSLERFFVADVILLLYRVLSASLPLYIIDRKRD